MNKSATESMGRRFLASAVGLATLVTEPSEVCREEGRFLKIPADILEGILSSSSASHIYFREILEVAWEEVGGEDRVVGTLQPESLDDHMKSSTDWYVGRVCGLAGSPRPTCLGGGAGGAGAPPHADSSTDEDWHKLGACLQTLWQEEHKKNTW